MRFHDLDTIVLERYLPGRGLQKGDLGAVVQVYGSKALKWSSSRPSRTQALVTLSPGDLRCVTDEDLIAARSLVHGAD